MMERENREMPQRTTEMLPKLQIDSGLKSSQIDYLKKRPLTVMIYKDNTYCCGSPTVVTCWK